MRRDWWVLAGTVAILALGCGGGNVGQKDDGLRPDLPVLDVPGEDTGDRDLASDAAPDEAPADLPARDEAPGDGLPADAPDAPADPGGDAADDLPPAGQCRPGDPCSDGDPCTWGDLCQQDLSCVGTPAEACDDGLDCTEDACTAADACTHAVKPGWCLVEGTCYQDGESDPALPCHACVTALVQDELIPDDTLPCDDGDPCTSGDRCAKGACLGTPRDCDDDNPCTADRCEAGQCAHDTLQGPCDDGSLCTENDTCVDGACVGTAAGCFDGNPCTDDDCDPALGCTHAFNNEACDDGNVCTVGDACVQGECRAGTGRLACDDGNLCTDDGCVPTRPEGCVHIPNIAPCDDLDPCTIGDQCRKGGCVPGFEAPDCDDANACTDDRCEPFVGCVNAPNTDPCDDGEPCFLDDVCSGGACVPGPTPLDCNDGNLCTDDFCEVNIGCVQRPNTVSCNDGNVCTMEDRCTAGSCVGKLPLGGVCNDDNDCTADFCNPGKGCTSVLGDFCQYETATCASDGSPCTPGGCAHKAMPECRPSIVIDWPPRAATLAEYAALNSLGERKICVRGHIEYPKDGLLVPWVTINGRQCMVNPSDRTFVCPATMDDGSGVCTKNADGSLNGYPMSMVQGFNPIVVNAEDISCEMGGGVCFADHLVQSFYYSPKWFPVDVNNPEASRIKDGIKMFLGQEVWDDNDTSTPDDIATILTLLVQQLNISSLIQNPVTSGSFGWCKYRVNLRNFRYGPLNVDLSPTWGGLYFKVVIPSFSVDIDVPVSGFLCPDFSGDASASSITLEATVMLSMGADGNPRASIANPNVTVRGLDVDVDGIWGFLFNWIIDFFEDDFANMIEEQFEAQMAGQIGDMIADAIKNLALDQTFQIPAFLPGAKPLDLRILARPSTLDFTPAGGVIGMASTVLVPRAIGWSPLGSIGRASCLGPDEGALNFPKHGSLEMALHDDFFNLIPYALYWGGGLKLPIDAATLGGEAFDLGAYGISELVLNLDFRLAPILSSCNPQQKLDLQVGDIEIKATMKLFGSPVQMQMFASLNSEAIVKVQKNAQTGQNEIALAISEPVFIDIEIASIAGGLVGAEDTLGELIRGTAIPMVLKALSGNTLVSFPIPEIDLHAISDMMPVGSKIAIDIRELLRLQGNTVVSGVVK